LSHICSGVNQKTPTELKGISIFALIENINPEQLVRQTKTNKTEKHNTT
jgi:hypothetical protein